MIYIPVNQAAFTCKPALMDKFDALSEMPCPENRSRRGIKKVLYLVKSLLRKREMYLKAHLTLFLEFRTEYRSYKVK